MAIGEGFDQIVRDHGAMIWRIAGSHERQPALAEELVQDIHLAIWLALPSFRGEASLRTFVARIATYRAVTHLARSRKAPACLELDQDIAAPGDNPEMHAAALSRQARLIQAVGRLPLAYRQTVLLTLEGLSPGEVAETLGITANAVAIRLSRAKEILREQMGEEP
jgi:RNA polymerase sigma-70 factor (ECF subfamily)